jgi:hypothetical protein
MNGRLQFERRPAWTLQLFNSGPDADALDAAAMLLLLLLLP